VFENILARLLDEMPMRLTAYCFMPNHWHLVLWPGGGELPRFMHRLTLTHAKRWHVSGGTAGTGHLYQDRYKAIPVCTASYFLQLVRYVERNPVRAGLVAKAQDWPWSSAHAWDIGLGKVPLAPWPIPRPANSLDIVNGPMAPLKESVLP
jgi:putative transposase